MKKLSLVLCLLLTLVALLSTGIVASAQSSPQNEEQSVLSGDYKILVWSLENGAPDVSGTYGNFNASFQKVLDEVDPDIVLLDGMYYSEYINNCSSFPGYGCLAHGTRNGGQVAGQPQVFGGGVAVIYKTDKFEPHSELKITRKASGAWGKSEVTMFPLVDKANGATIPVVNAWIVNGRTDAQMDELIKNIDTLVANTGAEQSVIVLRACASVSSDTGLKYNTSFNTTEADANGYIRTNFGGMATKKDSGEFSNGAVSTSYYTYILTLGKNQTLVKGMDFVGITEDPKAFPNRRWASTGAYPTKAFAFDFQYGDAVETVTKHTVTFLGFNDVVLDTQQIEDGLFATAPQAPFVEGYRFDGWDIAFDAVTSDLTVKAQYVKTWKVTYLDLNGDVYKVEVYDEGAVPSLPQGPIVPGYLFETWAPNELPALYEDKTVASVYSVRPTTANKDYKVMQWVLGGNSVYVADLTSAVKEADPDILILSGMGKSAYTTTKFFNLPDYTILCYGDAGMEGFNATTGEWGFRYNGGAPCVMFKSDKFTAVEGVQADVIGRNEAYTIFTLTDNEGIIIPVVVGFLGTSHTAEHRTSLLNRIKAELGTNFDTAIVRIVVESYNEVGIIHNEEFNTEADENGFRFVSDGGTYVRKTEGTHASVSHCYVYMLTYGKDAPAAAFHSNSAVTRTEDATNYPNAQGNNAACYNVAYTMTFSISSAKSPQPNASQPDSASITLQDNLLVNFKVNAAKLEGKELLKAVITFGGKTYEMLAGEVVGGQYVFSVPVAPYQMNDQIEIYLVFANDYVGEFEGIVTRYSVANYCYNKLADAEGEFRALLVSILNYGAAAQVAVGHDVENLANAKFSDADKLVVNGEINASSTQTEASEDHSALWSAAGLVLSDKIVVRFAFDAASVDGLTVKVDLNGNVYYINEFTPAGDGKYYVFIEGLSAHQLRDELKVTVLDAEGEASATLTYSVAVYATKVLARENQEGYEKLSALVRAMMAYGDAAYAYKY